MKFLCSLLFLLFFSNNISGQSLNAVDSLLDKGEYDLAMSKLKTIDTLSLAVEERAEYLKFLGETHKLTGSNELAAEKFLEGLGILGYGNKSKIATNLYIELSNISRINLQHEKAVEYARTAVDLALLHEDSLLTSNAYTIFGNAYYAAEYFDSTIHYYQLAEQFSPANDFRKKALLRNNAGNILMNKEDYAAALPMFVEATLSFEKGGYVREKCLALLNQSSALVHLNRVVEAQPLIDSIYVIVDKQGWDREKMHLINLDLLALSKKERLPRLSELSDSLGEVQHRIMSAEIRTAEEKYESERLQVQVEQENAKYEIEKLKAQRRSVLIALLSLGLLLTAFLFYYYLRNQKLKENLKLSKITLANQQALTSERTRIASEMHDDLGSGLTSIRFLSQKLMRKVDTQEDANQLSKIVEQSETLVNNMSEIIWAMNAGFDTLESLIAYSRRFMVEFLEDHEVAYAFQVEGETKGIKISGEKRRNLFLVIKEALHNVVKHAEASKVNINFDIGEQLEIRITDDGKGMGQSSALGNGLNNMRERIEKLNGKFSIASAEGLCIKVEVPIGQERKAAVV